MSDPQYLLRLGVDTGIARPEVDDLTRSLTSLGSAADGVLGRSRAASRASASLAKSQSDASAAALLSTTRHDRMTDSVTGADKSLRAMVSTAGKVVAGYLGIAAASDLVRDSVRVFAEVETALVGVAKTTGIQGQALDELLDEVTALATGPVPLLTTQLLELGEAAGQVGVTGSENILRYIETFARLGAATDLHGEDAVRTLTRLLNVQGEGPEQVETMASVLVQLGNNLAASESEIARHTSEVGRATAQFQIGSTAALAFGGALASIGSRAEGGGTAIGRTMREIQAAVSEGGKSLDEFAEIADSTAEEFADAWRDDPVRALNRFLVGLGRFGADAGVALERVGLGGDELAKVLPVLAANYGLLAQAQTLANDEAERGTALAAESDASFATLDASLTRLRNSLDAVRRAVGFGLSPAIEDAATGVSDWTKKNRDLARSLGEELGLALRHATRLLLLMLDNIDLLVAGLKALIALKAIVWVTTLTRGFAAAVPVLSTYIGAQAATEVATSATGAALTRTSPILDQYGRNFAVTATNTERASKATRGFLHTGLTPLAGGLTAAMAVLLLLNGNVNKWSQDLDGDIKKNIAGVRDFEDEIRRLHWSVRELTQEHTIQAREAQRLMEMGLRIGDDGEAQARHAVQVELQRERARLMHEELELATQLSKKKRELNEERLELGPQVDQLAQRKEELSAALELAEEIGPIMVAGIAVEPDGSFQELAEELAQVESSYDELSPKMKELDRQHNEISRRLKAANEAVDALNEAWVEQAEQYDFTRRKQGAYISALEKEAQAQERLLAIMRRTGESASVASTALKQLLSSDNKLAEGAAVALARRLHEAEQAVVNLQMRWDELASATSGAQVGRALLRFDLDSADQLRDQVEAALAGLDGEFVLPLPGAEELSRLSAGMRSLGKIAQRVTSEAEERRAIEQEINLLVIEGVITERERADALRESLREAGLLEGSFERQVRMMDQMAHGLGSIADSLGRLGGVIGGEAGGFIDSAGSVFGGLGDIAGGLSTAATATGALGALGGVLGAFAAFFAVGIEVLDLINKDYPKAAGEIQASAGRAQSTMRGTFGEIGQMVAGFGADVADGINQVVERLGGTLEALGHLDFSIQLNEDGSIREALVNGVNFGDDLAAATSFAVATGLRNAQITGLSPEVRQTLEKTGAQTMEQLEVEIARALRFEGGRIGEERLEFRDQIRFLVSDLIEGVKQGLDASGGLGQISANLGARRDEILGIVRSEEEIRRQRAEFFNAELQLQIARLDAERARLEALRGLGEQRARLAEAEITVGGSLVDGLAGVVGGIGILANRTVNVATQIAAASGGIDAQLDAIARARAALENLVISDVDLAGAGSGGGGRGRRRQFLDSLDAIEHGALSAASQAVAELASQLEEITRLSERYGVSEERLARVREILIAQAEREILGQLDEFFGPGKAPGTGGTFGLSGLEADRAEIDALFEEARQGLEELALATGERVAALGEIEAAHQRALEALAEDAVDQLGLPLENLRDEVAAYAEALDFLAAALDEGTLSAERYEEVVGQAAIQAELRVLSFAASLLETAGASEDAAAIRMRISELEFHVARAQLNFFLAEAEALGLLSDDVLENLQGTVAWINNPDNWPDFTAPLPIDPPEVVATGSGGASATDQAARDAERVAEQIARQIEQWTESAGPFLSRATAISETLDRLTAEAARFGLAVDDLAAAAAVARQKLVDDAIRDLEDDGLTSLESGLRSLTERILDIREAFEAVGATADDWERLAAAQNAAFESFWERATQPLRDFLDSLQADDPRVTTQERFEDAQARFRDLLARAQGGDLAALDELRGAAEEFDAARLEFLGQSGAGSFAALDELLAARELLNDPSIFLGGGDNDGDVQGGILDATERGNDILAGILSALGGGSGRRGGDLAAPEVAANDRGPSNLLLFPGAPAPSAGHDLPFRRMDKAADRRHREAAEREARERELDREQRRQQARLLRQIESHLRRGPRASAV